MKTKYLLMFFAGTLLFGCAEDKGNYKYTPIDEVTIDGIASNYSRTLGEALSIPVALSHTLAAGDSDLEYLWEIDGKAVAETKDLDIVVDNMSYGNKTCRYTVSDTRTGMKFYGRFNLNVVSAFNWGYYFLTEAADKSTVLSYMPAVVEEGREFRFTHVTSIGGHTFGHNPRAIVGTFGYISSLKDYYWTMNIMTRDGEYPFIKTENATFIPNALINSDNFMDKSAGYTFNPDYATSDRQNKTMYFISDGKMMTFGSGLLYRPAKHGSTYKWKYPVASDGGWALLFVFDDLSKKYYIIKPQPNDPANGIIGDSYAYDRAVEIGFTKPVYANGQVVGEEPITPPSFEGHYILGYSPSTSTINNVGFDILKVISGNSEGLHITELSIANTTEKGIPNENPRVTKTNVTGITADSKALLISMDWFVSAGNKIYTSPNLLPVFTEFVTLPADLGTITEMRPTGMKTTLVVTTYNPSSAAEKKGSVVFIDLQTKEMTIHKNVIDKCVSFLCANTNAFWGETGDEK